MTSTRDCVPHTLLSREVAVPLCKLQGPQTQPRPVTSTSAGESEGPARISWTNEGLTHCFGTLCFGEGPQLQVLCPRGILDAQSGGKELPHACSESVSLPLFHQKTFEDTPCPALSLPPGAHTVSKPSITINLANFLGHTIPPGTPLWWAALEQDSPLFPFPFNYTGTSFLGLTLGGKPPASLAALHQTMHTCSGEFPPCLIRAGKKRAFLLFVKGDLRC